MSVSPRRIRAIVRKELRDYRRNGHVVTTMAIFPLIFLIQPLVALFLVTDSAAPQLGRFHLLLYMLAIPVLVPAGVAAAAVAGERVQGTLEPLLTTPIRRDELLLGKAIAVLVPSVAIGYAVYAFFLVCVAVFGRPLVAAALLQSPDLLAQLVFTPLLALAAIWIGIAISTRTSDVRTAQQLSLLGSIPMVLVTSALAFDVVHVTLGLMIGLGTVLVLADGLGWRLVSSLFDRERLVTGSR